MKITKAQLSEMIREAVSEQLNEQYAVESNATAHGLIADSAQMIFRLEDYLEKIDSRRPPTIDSIKDNLLPWLKNARKALARAEDLVAALEQQGK